MARAANRILTLALVLAASLAGAEEYAYTVETTKTFDATVDAVRDTALAHGFKVPGVHTLPARTYQFVLIEVCDAAAARQLLATDPTLGLLLPCGKIGVYEDPEDRQRTKISLLLPSALVRIRPTAPVRRMAEELRPRLLRIVDDAR